jgi:uncharacterized protein
MTDTRFGWDDRKAAQNYAKHGVRFEHAVAIFRDPFAIEYLDERMDHGEERFIRIGIVDGAVLTVCYTDNEESPRVTRLISARHATRREQDEYFRQDT